jgi:hypothetical protein
MRCKSLAFQWYFGRFSAVGLCQRGWSKNEEVDVEAPPEAYNVPQPPRGHPVDDISAASAYQDTSGPVYHHAHFVPTHSYTSLTQFRTQRPGTHPPSGTARSTHTPCTRSSASCPTSTSSRCPYATRTTRARCPRTGTPTSAHTACAACGRCVCIP